MSAEAATSILDAALTCFGQRILTVLSQPGDKNENYIASLHNEVVSIARCSEGNDIAIEHNLDLACCHLDCWSSVIKRQPSICTRVSEDRLPQFFGHQQPGHLHCT
jgi:hypothetical protein